MQNKKVLYLGTDPNYYKTSKEVIHCPLLHMTPRDRSGFTLNSQLEDFPSYTHILVTSKTTVNILLSTFNLLQGSSDKHWICIGASTAEVLKSYGMQPMRVAREETQEGMIKLLDLLDLESAYLFYPRSSRARPTLAWYLKIRQLRHQVCDLYDTSFSLPSELPSLEEIDEIVFTSPSTVEAFFVSFPHLPSHIELTALGPITKGALERFTIL